MTQPHLMNCPHSEEGWCLSCLKVEWERWDELTKPAEIVHSLEPVPCAKCEAYQQRIAALEKELEWWKAAAEMADDETYDPLP